MSVRVLRCLRTAMARGKRQALIVYFVARDPRTPWGARLLALFIAAYALSPVDLIPDFIPVLGYLDDALLIPLGFWLVLRLTPPEVLAAASERATPAASKAAGDVHIHCGEWMFSGTQ